LLNGGLCYKYRTEENPSLAVVGVDVPAESVLSAFSKAVKLFMRKEMMLLAFTFFYTGIELSFFSGVYSSSVGFTNRFTEAKRLVGLCGILVGGGEVIGGAIFGLLGSRTVKNGNAINDTIK
jgi:preprotein translocase subunit SecG